MEYSLGEIAELIGGELLGDATVEIKGIKPIEEAAPEDIAILSHPKYTRCLRKTQASALIVSNDSKLQYPNIIKVANTRYALSQVLNLFYPKKYQPSGISPQAIVGKDCRIGKDVSLYPLVYVGDSSSIGDRVVIHSGVIIGEGVTIGEETIIHPNVSICPHVHIGKRVIIHSGCVIGSDGFGYVKEKGVYHKIPQVGTVIIEDDVELGANVCVDRATMGATRIRRGVKVDNLVQIAHNVVIGEDSILVSLVGLSGSTSLGREVIMGGQSGIAEHVELGDRVMVAAKAGITKDIPPDSVVAGFPAIAMKKWKEQIALFHKLPQLFEKMEAIEKKLDSLIKQRG